MLFTVAQQPQYPDSSSETASIQGLSAELPAMIPGLSANITAITEADITASFLVNGESFPMLEPDDTFVPFAQHHLIPDIPIPEPATLVLLATALSSIYAYGL